MAEGKPGRTASCDRHDVAVVLARGRSRRMGRPKGLCRLPGDDDCFLVRIARLYAGLGLPVAVVTTSALHRRYEPVLGAATPPATWIERPGGGGTAGSVAAALARLPGATHLWLHPVDLPAVAAPTLERLRRLSRRHPRTVLVPVHGGRPGHPVVLPSALPALRRDGPARGSMRRWLLAAAAVARRDGGPELAIREVPVDDAGVVTDYDDPAALRGGRPSQGRKA